MIRTTAFGIVLLLMVGHEIAAEEAVFVAGGKARSVQEVGKKWTADEDALLCSGTGNLLVADRALGPGDFEVRARLAIKQFDGTAASLAFGQNHFGFDAGSGMLFIEGAQLGNTRSLCKASDFITPGKPFDLEFTRQGNLLTFRIDGKEVYKADYRLMFPEGQHYGGNHYHSEGVTVARFSLPWLTDGQDTLSQGQSP